MLSQSTTQFRLSTHHFSCWCCPIYHSIRTLFATFPASAVPFTTPFGLYSPLFLLVLSHLPLHSDSIRHFSCWYCPSCHSIRTLFATFPAGAVPVAIRFGLYSPLFCWCCPSCHPIRTLFTTFPADAVPVATPFGALFATFTLGSVRFFRPEIFHR